MVQSIAKVQSVWYIQRRGEIQIMRKEIREEKVVVTTTMSKAYQITVPSVIRRMLGLEPGDPVDFKMERGRAVLVKAETQEEQVRKMVAEFDRLNEESRKRSTPEQKKLMEMTKGWTVNQFHEYFDNLPETKEYIKEKYGVEVQ